MLIKLSEYAKRKGICYKTAYNKFKAGKLDGAIQDKKTKTIMIEYNNPKVDRLHKIRKLLDEIEQMED